MGVTATSINVGNVSSLSGPIPGLFQGGPYGTQAYFDYVNSQGGVYGRQLKLSVFDDGLQCAQDQAAYQNSVNRVFAYVGGWSLENQCATTVMQKYPTVPMVQMSVGADFQNLPNEYSSSPFQAGAWSGPYEYFAQRYPQDIKAVGTLITNQSSAIQAWNYYLPMFNALGYKIIDQDEYPAGQANFTSDVLRMRSDGVKMVLLIAINGTDSANFSSSAAQQNWHPLTMGVVAYYNGYVSQAGGASSVNGQFVELASARFLGEDAATVPEVALFDHWMKVAYPSFAINEFAMNSWTEAALFVQAIKSVGPNLTRAKLLAALSNIRSFDDNGMIAPANVGAKTGSNCFLLLQIANGVFTRPTGISPPTGFTCSGRWYPAH